MFLIIFALTFAALELFGYLEVTNWSTFYYSQHSNFPIDFTSMLLVGGLWLALILSLVIFSLVLAIEHYPKVKRMLLFYVGIFVLSEVIVIILYGVTSVYWGFKDTLNLISNPNYLVMGAIGKNENVLFYAAGLVVTNFVFTSEISAVIAVPFFSYLIIRDLKALKKEKKKREEFELDERIKKAIEKDRMERETKNEQKES